MSRFSRTERKGKTSRPSGTWAMPCAATRSGRKPVMSCPLSSTRPLSGSRMPEMVLSVLDLPAPLAPSNVTNAPSFTSIDRPFTA